MRRASVIIALATALVGLSSTSTAQPDPNSTGTPACFAYSALQATRPAGLRAIYARVNGRELYRIDLAADCNGLASRYESVVLRPMTAAGQICSPFDLSVSLKRSHERCPVKDIVRLSSVETAAIPRKARP